MAEGLDTRGGIEYFLGVLGMFYRFRAWVGRGILFIVHRFFPQPVPLVSPKDLDKMIARFTVALEGEGRKKIIARYCSDYQDWLRLKKKCGEPV